MPRKYTKIPKENRKKGEYYEYKRIKERMLRKAKYFDEKWVEYQRGLNAKYAKIARKEFFKVFNDAIKEWYDAYQPKAYKKRKKSLYQIPYFDIDNSDKDNITATFGDDDPSRIKRWHRVSDEYIYINSYLRGYHGGADMLGDNPVPGYEMPHPHPRTGPFGVNNDSGVPYWRWPTKPKGGFIRWQLWYPTPAVRTESPDMIANRNWEFVKEQIEQEYNKEKEKLFLKIGIEFREYYNKYKRW